MTDSQPASSISRVIGEVDRELLLSRIRDVPDWPEPGVVFKDITPLLRDPVTFALTIDLLTGDLLTGDLPADDGRGAGRGVVDVVAGIEARGLIFGAPVAHRLGAGFVPVRKEGKLPFDTSAMSYELEYGHATIEVHRDAFTPGERVLIVDDVLATGGTVRATIDLIRGAGAEVVGVSVLMELGFLHGRDRLPDVDLWTLLSV